jgi:hypothetical protein
MMPARSQPSRGKLRRYRPIGPADSLLAMAARFE